MHTGKIELFKQFFLPKISLISIPFIEDCIKTLEEDWYAFDNLPRIGIVFKTGPVHFQKSFLKFIHDDSTRIIAFPSSYFFPIDYKNMDLIKKIPLNELIEKTQMLYKPETFAAHFWAGTWTTAIITEKNKEDKR
ncbi:hypothetical protein H0X06_04145 [Candidatus Dependentiae bacterium]|nr:hypothetical protein [Candidatus Dependentiae bacterium]